MRHLGEHSAAKSETSQSGAYTLNYLTLNKEELQQLIDQFDEQELKQHGIFNISQYGGGSDESFIKANKEGLELFALQLLKSARDIEDVLANTGQKIIPFDHEGGWMEENSNTFIQYIEPVASKQKLIARSDNKSSLTDKLMPYGCGLIALILAASVVTGLITILRWIF